MPRGSKVHVKWFEIAFSLQPYFRVPLMTCAAERVTCLTLWRVFKWLYNELCQPSTFWIWGWLLFALSHFKSWWNKSLHCIMRGLIILALLFVSWHCLWRGTSAPNTSRCRLWWLKLVWDGRVLGCVCMMIKSTYDFCSTSLAPLVCFPQSRRQGVVSLNFLNAFWKALKIASQMLLDHWLFS